MMDGNKSSAVQLEGLEEHNDLRTNIQNISLNLQHIETLLEKMPLDNYNKFSIKDQVSLDLFTSYTLNTLYWMYMRTQGMDPTVSNIKSELNRVRGYITRANKVHDRKMPKFKPRLTVQVAERMIRSGLWHPEARMAERKRARMESAINLDLPDVQQAEKTTCSN